MSIATGPNPLNPRNTRVRFTEQLTISDLNDRDDLQLITDSQDVEAVKQNLGPAAKDFDGFLVKVGEGEYVEVYGFMGSTPELWKPAIRLIGPKPVPPSQRLDLKHGDKVKFLNPQGKVMQGVVTMRSSLPGAWVVNAGGRHGTPYIVDATNIVSVKSG